MILFILFSLDSLKVEFSSLGIKYSYNAYVSVFNSIPLSFYKFISSKHIFKDVTIEQYNSTSENRFLLNFSDCIKTSGCLDISSIFLGNKYTLYVQLTDRKNNALLMNNQYSFRSRSSNNEKLFVILNEQIYKSILAAMKEYKPEIFKVTGTKILNTKIGIIPFYSSGEEAKKLGLGETFSAMLFTIFKRTTNFQIVEREVMQKIIEEFNISMSGLVKPELLKKAGKMVAADYFIYGVITKIDKKIEVDFKIIDINAAEVISSNYDFVYNDLYLRYLAEDVVFKILEHFAKDY